MLDLPNSEAFERFIGYARLAKIDVIPLIEEAPAVVRHINTKSKQPPRNLALSRRWYASLVDGKPDYDVYDSDDYLAELWGCWVAYSRNYLKLVAGLSLGTFDSVTDLGCGFGFSTAALKLMYPNARVCGTNVKGTSQWRIAELVGEDYGFEMRTEPVKSGLVLASEYFEHFESPVNHLIEVLTSTMPRVMVVASTFTQPSIGHFPAYKVDRGKVSGKHIGRWFDVELKVRGYRKLDTGFWNNRPTVWVHAS